MQRINWIWGWALLSLGAAQAQEVITLDDAARIAFENNFDIRVANAQKQIALNNTDKLNLGLLPTASASAGGTYSLTSSNGKRADGAEFSVNNAGSSSLNASVGANYSIYEGNYRKYNFQKLKEQYQLTEIEAQVLMENVLMQLYNQYYQVAFLSKTLSIQDASLEISRLRLKRVKYGFDYGSSSRLDVLNAEVDIQNDSVAYLNTIQQLQNAKSSLNLLMGRAIETDFSVNMDVLFRGDLTLDELLRSAPVANTSIQVAQKNIDLNNVDLLLNKTNLYPKVSANASYGWNANNFAPTSFLQSQNSLGLNAGVNVSWAIFDGGKRRIAEQNLLVSKEIQQTLLEKQLSTLERDVRNAWQVYQNALLVMKSQQASVETNQLNFDYTQDQFSNGQTNSVFFRQAQLNLLNAQTQFEKAKYDAKIAEFTLLQLVGKLLE